MAIIIIILADAADTNFWFGRIEGAIQVRSALQPGSSDFGVNRKRIEFIREKLNSS